MSKAEVKVGGGDLVLDIIRQSLAVTCRLSTSIHAFAKLYQQYLYHITIQLYSIGILALNAKPNFPPN